MKRYTFPKNRKVRRRTDYLAIAKRGRYHRGICVIVEILPTAGEQQTRCGITVSRRYGPAHQRNHFKRIVREAFRLNQHRLPDGYDINIKPRRGEGRIVVEGVGRDIVEALA